MSERSGINYLSEILEEVNQYPVLSKEKLYDFFNKYNNGDEEAFNIIFYSNLRLVLFVTKSFMHRVDDEEIKDVFQVGCEALMNSIKHFDVSKGFKFSTYVYSALWRKMVYYINLNKNKFMRNSISLQLPAVISDDNSLELEDTLIDESVNVENVIEDENFKIIFYDLINSIFDDKTKNVFQLRFGVLSADRHSIAEISKITGMNRYKVTSLLKTGLIKLKHALYNDNRFIGYKFNRYTNDNRVPNHNIDYVSYYYPLEKINRYK